MKKAIYILDLIFSYMDRAVCPKLQLRLDFTWFLLPTVCMFGGRPPEAASCRLPATPEIKQLCVAVIIGANSPLTSGISE